MFDPHRVRADFPVFSRTVHDKPLVYLDSAATSQMPEAVIEAVAKYSRFHRANVHRGVHLLGDESTRAFDDGRQSIASFFGAVSEELIFVRNTTEALNLLVYGWAEQHLQSGQAIVVTEMEHHSNLVPWQELARRKQLELLFIPVKADGRLDQEAFHTLIANHTIGLFACTHVSNTLGTLNPVREMARELKRVYPQALVVLDGAQAAPHLPLKIWELECDFYAVSAHKMLGPMGVGGLFVHRKRLSELEPVCFGGGMIDVVTMDQATFAESAQDRFTAGTPDVEGVVGWAAACAYMQKLDMSDVLTHDQELVQCALEALRDVPEVTLIGPGASGEPANDRVGSVSFLYEGVHAHDVGQVLDAHGVAVRTGHHCTMPLHTKFGWQATIRASFQVYSVKEDIEALVTALGEVKKVFRR